MSTNPAKSARSALVFGGARGIGAAAVRRLSADGHAVAFTYLSGADKARALVREIEAAGGQAHAVQADSADPSAIQAAVVAATDRFGALDMAVVNAGILKFGTIDVVTLEELDRMIAINVRGVFLAIQASAAHMHDGGRIVTIGSIAAIRAGGPGRSVYQFTKAAVAAMVKGLALDLAPRRITLNNIQPGPTETDMTEGMREMLVEQSPLRRIAAPAEIAGLIAYLAREESGYVTGASLTIDGGFFL